jgi:hypothetical protein
MSWRLWLDDDLNDPERPERLVPEGFLGARTSGEAKALVLEHGIPEYMDLDFDLGMVDGQKDTAENFLRWLADNYYETPPEHHVHSRNNQGAPWIESWMSSWRRSLTM